LLNCNTTYHFRAYATSVNGTGYGSDTTFTTGACIIVSSTPVVISSGGGGVVGGPLGIGFVNAATSSSNSTPPARPPSILTVGASTPGAAFTRELQFRDRHPDVRRLQSYLNTHGFQVAATGPGSAGFETDLFGSLTYRALVRFQEAHAQEILAPLGLTQGTGYFGPATIRFISNSKGS
jgi:hypothetical protein